MRKQTKKQQCDERLNLLWTDHKTWLQKASTVVNEALNLANPITLQFDKNWIYDASFVLFIYIGDKRCGKTILFQILETPVENCAQHIANMLITDFNDNLSESCICRATEKFHEFTDYWKSQNTSQKK